LLGKKGYVVVVVVVVTTTTTRKAQGDAKSRGSSNDLLCTYTLV